MLSFPQACNGYKVLLKEALQNEGTGHEKESWEPMKRKDRGSGEDGAEEGQREGEDGAEEGQREGEDGEEEGQREGEDGEEEGERKWVGSMVQVRGTLPSVKYFFLKKKIWCFFQCM